jgi:PadR family transcriptional regulator, regulatory protein PadR
MAYRRNSSPQSRAVLKALHGHPAEWRYGYDLARETGLASGTLYPLLARLCDQGLLEARWEDDVPGGRPRRHLYRLTGDGAMIAVEVAKTAPAGGQAAPGAGSVRPARGGA